MIQILVLSLCSMFIVSDDKGQTPKGIDQLEGVWSVIGVEVNGQSQPKESFSNHRVIVTKQGRYVVAQGDQITHGVVTLDSATAPKNYDVEVTSGPAIGMKFTGLVSPSISLSSSWLACPETCARLMVW